MTTFLHWLATAALIVGAGVVLVYLFGSWR